jgi:hypothetical protein
MNFVLIIKTLKMHENEAFRDNLTASCEPTV